MLSFHHFSGNKIVSILLTIVVIGVNLYFVVAQVETLNIEGGLLAVVCTYFILVVPMMKLHFLILLIQL